MQVTSSKQLSNEHAAWQSSLGFYKDELVIYRGRLTEIAGKNTSKEIMQQTEHFQNQFLVHIESIDTISHDIKMHVKQMAAEMQEQAGHISHQQLAVHEQLKERVETEDRLFTGLKHEFALFLAKVM
jgi:hypothetical protein